MKTYTERVKNSENYVTTDNEATVAALYAWNEKQKVFAVETCSTYRYLSSLTSQLSQVYIIPRNWCAPHLNSVSLQWNC